MKKDFSEISKSYKEVGPYLGLGTQLAATMVLMFFLGRWIDSLLSTGVLNTVIFSFLGAFGGTYNFIKTVLNLNKKKHDSKL